ncbi:hypothetical protein GN244_ATG17226 [Phytophthora infestans]|uniref:Protein kinase n=1 Tax=Phytophthora infestans TaxID=4787 RepID=A0A833SHK4_PHYIN|nr:hypothetical protein GN244_ATG17226 [Phytophthora infestans]
MMIPRDKVKVKKLLSRGAMEKFNLRSSMDSRGNLQHVTDFLTEAKLTSSMDHPRIVTFVGVAWDSLSDLCCS